MAEVQVVEVESSAQLKEFILLPNRLYRHDPNYVTPLFSERKAFFDTARNPFYRAAKTKLFLAMRGAEVVGRIATCISYRHNDFHVEKTGFFGFFDTLDDYEIAHPLLKVAMITLKKDGMERMRGPMNFTTNHEVGFLVEGFDSPPTVMMTYNQPFQVKLAEQFGLKKCMDLVAYRLTKDKAPSERILRVVRARAKRTRVKIRTLDMRQFDREVKLIKDVYNQSWAANWGFIPMDDAEFEYVAKDLRQIVDPRIVLIAEHEGKAVGFSLALPDINQALIKLRGRLFPLGLLKLLWHTKVRNKVNGLRMITFGILEEYRKQAIDLMLYTETFYRGSQLGYEWAELSWILETNDLMRRAADDMQARLYKKYRIMEMPL